MFLSKSYDYVHLVLSFRRTSQFELDWWRKSTMANKHANKPTDSRYVKGSRYYGEAGYINYRDWSSPYQQTSTPSHDDMRYGESLYRDGATQAGIIAEEHGIRAMIDQIERKRRGIGI